MVSRVGLEPTTPSLRGSCSNQLSYRPTLTKNVGKDFAILTYFMKNKKRNDLSRPSAAIAHQLKTSLH